MSSEEQWLHGGKEHCKYYYHKTPDDVYSDSNDNINFGILTEIPKDDAGLQEGIPNPVKVHSTDPYQV